MLNELDSVPGVELGGGGVTRFGSASHRWRCRCRTPDDARTLHRMNRPRPLPVRFGESCAMTASTLASQNRHHGIPGGTSNVTSSGETRLFFDVITWADVRNGLHSALVLLHDVDVKMMTSGNRTCREGDALSFDLLDVSLKISIEPIRDFTQMTRPQNVDLTTKADRNVFLLLSIGRHVKFDTHPCIKIFTPVAKILTPSCLWENPKTEELVTSESSTQRVTQYETPVQTKTSAGDAESFRRGRLVCNWDAAAEWRASRTVAPLLQRRSRGQGGAHVTALRSRDTGDTERCSASFWILCQNTTFKS